MTLAIKIKKLCLTLFLIGVFDFSAIYAGVISGDTGGALFTIVAASSLLYVCRLRCPHCDKKLSEIYRAGMFVSLLFLWFVRENCHNCGQELR